MDRQDIKHAKGQYRKEVESYYTLALSYVAGHADETDYKEKHSREMPSDGELPNEMAFMLASRITTSVKVPVSDV
jgi:hypothetical protein